MYYEEKIIGGVLCYRLSSDGSWEPLSTQELTIRLAQVMSENKDLRKKLANMGWED